jgi:glucan-binding YG repeat protein
VDEYNNESYCNATLHYNSQGPDEWPDAAYTGWITLIGRDYWYENAVLQGYDPKNPDYRGKEIYDPDSDAWYWLDNIQQGAKAVNKDVYQESEAGQWAENADGTGKWVRYDANGHMVKGWQTTDQGTYYFDTVYGTMAKGTAMIDGMTYYFDLNTGILQSTSPVENGWWSDGGQTYWYENGIRQGYDPNNTDYRGKEIYDPDSDAWYWLDNVQQGAKAVSKDVYQESEAGQWADRGDGTGKWVRYDANGHMVKGWQTTDQGTYYFDLVYGTMAKGNAEIDGTTYYFDVNTGILQ